MSFRRRRAWEDVAEEDPGAGLLNLFDVWMVFAISLLVAAVTAKGASAPAESQRPGESAEAPARLPQDRAAKLKHFRPSENRAGGDGVRLGTAYRLKNGEVVYVPDPVPR